MKLTIKQVLRLAILGLDDNPAFMDIKAVRDLLQDCLDQMRAGEVEVGDQEADEKQAVKVVDGVACQRYIRDDCGCRHCGDYVK
jgi:hypothetical protein